MSKIRIALLFGGVSSEHEISCLSCSTVMKNLNPQRYEIIPVGITKDGRWFHTPSDPQQVADGSWEKNPSNRKCVFSADRADHCLFVRQSNGMITPCPVDVVFPVLHGKNGEDGTVQGLLDLAGIPYVGCGVAASALCMDKALANTLFDAAGVPHCAWDCCTRMEAKDLDALEARLLTKLSYPIFVKPARAGSSVGITKAHDRAQLDQDVRTALLQDDKVVFEEFVDGQEVECAALGNDLVSATLPGEILAGSEFYTYDDKYKNGVSKTVIPAQLPMEKLEEVKALAIKAYKALGCTGLARCDFFVEKGTGRVLINEINTLPGFTSISMYPQLMEATGLPVPRLLDALVQLAFERAGV